MGRKFEVEEREWEWGCDVSYIKRGLGEYNIGARAEAGKFKLPGCQNFRESKNSRRPRNQKFPGNYNFPGIEKFQESKISKFPGNQKFSFS